MPDLVIEKPYVVTKDFPKPQPLEFSAQEFRDNGETNGLPGIEIQKREFTIAEDCTAAIRGFTTEFPAKKKVSDVALAYTLIRQGAPVIIRDTLIFKEGDEVPEEIGLKMKDEGLPVKVAPKKPIDPEPDETADKK